ncbi:hypothetical protein HDV05_000099 [Chytridiales sp. JEL 0842]|nr:hypothetical protein HDV05_000099 [Chytridiales sp. JEL 0842]
MEGVIDTEEPSSAKPTASPNIPKDDPSTYTDSEVRAAVTLLAVLQGSPTTVTSSEEASSSSAAVGMDTDEVRSKGLEALPSYVSAVKRKRGVSAPPRSPPELENGKTKQVKTDGGQQHQQSGVTFVASPSPSPTITSAAATNSAGKKRDAPPITTSSSSNKKRRTSRAVSHEPVTASSTASAAGDSASSSTLQDSHEVQCKWATCTSVLPKTEDLLPHISKHHLAAHRITPAVARASGKVTNGNSPLSISTATTSVTASTAASPAINTEETHSDRHSSMASVSVTPNTASVPANADANAQHASSHNPAPQNEAEPPGPSMSPIISSLTPPTHTPHTPLQQSTSLANNKSPSLHHVLDTPATSHSPPALTRQLSPDPNTHPHPVSTSSTSTSNHTDTPTSPHPPSTGIVQLPCQWAQCATLHSQAPSFVDIDDLFAHLYKDHLAYEGIVETPVDPHICLWEHCTNRFGKFEELTKHVASDHVQTGKSAYVCEWKGCEREGKPFHQRQKILRHLQTHTGDKPYQCDVCKQRFSDSNILPQHMRTHTGERPYRCYDPSCGKEFALPGALKIHARVHTGEKPFVCKETGCEKRFAESSNLTKHLRVHTGEKPFRCTITPCPKVFARPDQASRHIKTHEAKLKKNGEDLSLVGGAEQQQEGGEKA